MPVRTFIALLAIVSMPLGAAAQDVSKSSDDSAQQPPQTQGPMTVERVHDGWAIAPDFKVTRIDGVTSELAGAYGGWVFDEALLVGAGGYWMTNRTSSRELQYGGAVVEWFGGADRALGYTVRGLVGWGTSRLPGTIQNFASPLRGFDRDDLRQPTPTGTVQVVFRDNFFVFEPQADALIKLARLVRVDVGVGYRLIDGVADTDRRLRGATGSVALVIGGGFSDHR